MYKNCRERRIRYHFIVMFIRFDIIEVKLKYEYELFVDNMSGRNCCLNQCQQSDYKPKRKEKEHWKMFTVTTRKDEITEWRNELVNIIKKYREVDNSFYERLANGKIWICEKHFSQDSLEINSKLILICLYIL